ncbi:MAG TPA: glycosyltransferase family 4 protein [Trebonia sp.]|nr:glycosyltransferase family 4 protein [Trebonia sp.]
MTVQPLARATPRAVVLAASVAVRHVSDDPVRALTLAWRALPAPLRRAVRLAGPYGRAAALWGAGDRRAALTVLEAKPARLAAFSLAVDQPAVARSALARLPADSSAAPLLAARLSYREGQLSAAIGALDGAAGWRSRRLRRSLRAEVDMLTPGRLAAPVIPRADPVKGRVLHIVTDALPSVSAGYTVRTQEIAVAQRAAGLDPHVVTRIGFPVTAGKVDGRHQVDVDGVAYHRLLPLVMPGRMDSVASQGLRHAARLVAQVRPAVLHAASNYSNALTAIALREATGLPYVYEVRGFWEDTWLSRHAATAGLQASERYRLSRELEAHCMRSADLVVTLGEAMRDEIIDRGVDPGKILIVPNGVSEDFLRPLPDGAALRAQLGIAPGELAVGLVSSLVAHEGIGTLLEAVRLLRDGGAAVRALIVGDGPERAALQRQASSLGIDAIFTGRVPLARVREYHAALDVFVVPRTPDRVCQLVTPLKPVEAMASGLPVVVSAVRALGEIVRDKVTGLQAAPQDPAALADCLRELLERPELRRELGRNAREWVAEGRTWQHNAQRYREAYARLGAA